MSLIFMDGFDLYTNTSDMLLRGYANTPNGFATGRFPTGRCANISGGTASLQPPAVPSGDTFTAGFAMKLDRIIAGMGTGTCVLRFSGGGSTICKLGIDQNGALKFGRNDWTSQNLVSSANGLIVGALWYYVEVELVRHASAGSVNVWVNGVSVMSATGVNTGAASIDHITFFDSDNIDSGKYVDDVYFTNTAARLGECRVEVLRPSADTAEKDWTPSTGTSNFAMVDDTTPNGDTDYVAASTSGAYDLYDLTNLPINPTGVFGVQAVINARKDDATLRQVRSKLKSGSTTSDGASMTLGTSYTTSVDRYELNPDTSAPWTLAQVNALQLGIEVV